MRRVMVVVGALALAGCASITRGTTEQIQFESQPTGAVVHTMLLPVCDAACLETNYGMSQEVAGSMGKPIPGPSCITPCAAPFSRKDIIVATFSGQGLEPQTIRLEPRIATTGAMGFAGNIVAGGVTGMIIDASSGAMLEHCPNPASVVMRRVGSRDPVVAPNMNCPKPPAHDSAVVRANDRTKSY